MATQHMPDIGQPVHISKIDGSFCQPGVYFLYDVDAVVYVGQSKNVQERILQHIAENAKRFQRVSFQPCRLGQLLSLERRYIQLLLPKYNNCNLSNRLRSERIWVGIGTPRPHAAPKASLSTDEDAARFLGVETETFTQWREQGIAPEPVRKRLPRRRAVRILYSPEMLLRFAADHKELFPR